MKSSLNLSYVLLQIMIDTLDNLEDFSVIYY